MFRKIILAAGWGRCCGVGQGENQKGYLGSDGSISRER